MTNPFHSACGSINNVFFNNCHNCLDSDIRVSIHDKAILFFIFVHVNGIYYGFILLMILTCEGMVMVVVGDFVEVVGLHPFDDSNLCGDEGIVVVVVRRVGVVVLGFILLMILTCVGVRGWLWL